MYYLVLFLAFVFGLYVVEWIWLTTEKLWQKKDGRGGYR